MVTEGVTCSFQPLVGQPCSQAHVPAGHRSADPRQGLSTCWSLQPSVHSVQTHPPLGLCSQHTLAGPPPLPDCSPCPPTAVPAPSSSPWPIWAHCVLPVSFPLHPPGMEPEALVTTRDRSRGTWQVRDASGSWEWPGGHSPAQMAFSAHPDRRPGRDLPHTGSQEEAEYSTIATPGSGSNPLTVNSH